MTQVFAKFSKLLLLLKYVNHFPENLERTG